MTAPAQLIEGRRVAAMIAKAVAEEREACMALAIERHRYWLSCDAKQQGVSLSAAEWSDKTWAADQIAMAIEARGARGSAA